MGQCLPRSPGRFLSHGPPASGPAQRPHVTQLHTPGPEAPTQVKPCRALTEGRTPEEGQAPAWAERRGLRGWRSQLVAGEEPGTVSSSLEKAGDRKLYPADKRQLSFDVQITFSDMESSVCPVRPPCSEDQMNQRRVELPRTAGPSPGVTRPPVRQAGARPAGGRVGDSRGPPGRLLRVCWELAVEGCPEPPQSDGINARQVPMRVLIRARTREHGCASSRVPRRPAAAGGSSLTATVATGAPHAATSGPSLSPGGSVPDPSLPQ